MTSPTRPLNLFVFVLATFIASSPAFAKKVGKTQIPDTLEVAGQTLVLNGAGRRTRSIIKVYLGSLYLGAASDDAAAIVAADEPMAIQLNILSRFLSKAKLIEALQTGFNKSTGGDTSAIQPSIDRMFELLDEKIVKRDIFVLSYDPASGTTVTKNGNLIGSVEGLEFKQALFGIWLSDTPAQKSLKTRMLGG